MVGWGHIYSSMRTHRRASFFLFAHLVHAFPTVLDVAAVVPDVAAAAARAAEATSGGNFRV